MPILPAEPDLYPDHLWSPEGPRLEPCGDRRWWCLHARPRQEKATARHLHLSRIPFYLPMVAREGRTPAGRKIRSIVPLFPGYLFLLGDEHQRLEAFRANNLVQVLEVDDQESLDRDLRRIQQLLGSGLPVEPEPSHPIGSPIRIVTGPLAGLVGVVARRGDHDRFTAVVQFLKQGATVVLEDWQVERVEEPAGPGGIRGGLD